MLERAARTTKGGPASTWETGFWASTGLMLEARRGTSMRGRGVAGRGQLIDARGPQRAAPRARNHQWHLTDGCLWGGSAPPNGPRLSCGARRRIHSTIYARRQLQALVRRRLPWCTRLWWRITLLRVLLDEDPQTSFCGKPPEAGSHGDTDCAHHGIQDEQSRRHRRLLHGRKRFGSPRG